MDLLEALYTTRAMRRVRPDPVPHDVVAAMLDAAIRAPSGGNAQNWRFVVVTEPAVKERLGPIYRQSFETLQQTVYQRSWARAREAGDEQTLGIVRSSRWLADNFEQVPLWLFVYSRNDPSGASIYPAVWSAMLAARGHGVGTCLTTVMGLFAEDEVAQVLGVPAGKGWTLAAAISAGYPQGRWGIAARGPADTIAFGDRWDEPLGYDLNGPVWSDGA